MVMVGGSLLLVALWAAGCSGDEDEQPAPAATAGTGGTASGGAGSGGTAAGTGGTAGAGGSTAGAGGESAGAAGTAGTGGSTAGTGGTAGAAGAPVANEPALADLKQGEWNTLTPAGDTTCSDGSAFSYFVRPGKSNKIVVEFSGGGACWKIFPHGGRATAV